VQVKANQPTLLNDCERATKGDDGWLEYRAEIENSRNRIEERSIRVLNNFSATDDEWSEISTLGEITRVIERYNTKNDKWTKSTEISYFVSTYSPKPADFLNVVRGHWGIENSNHYVRDVAFEEDKSRIRNNVLNLAVIRSFALNIMRFNKAKNIKNERYKCALDPGEIDSYRGI
jgi:predicted transposase YbfD/YdcC